MWPYAARTFWLWRCVVSDICWYTWMHTHAFYEFTVCWCACHVFLRSFFLSMSRWMWPWNMFHGFLLCWYFDLNLSHNSLIQASYNISTFPKTPSIPDVICIICSLGVPVLLIDEPYFELNTKWRILDNFVVWHSLYL